MKVRIIIAIAAVLSVAITATAQEQKPDFSGMWVLDKNRSYNNGPGLDQTITLSLSGNEVTLDAKLTTPQGEREVHELWVLDGQQREATPTSAPSGAKAKRKAYWLPDNRRFVLFEETATDSPKSASIQQITRKFSLSPDGSTLTVDYYVDRPQLSGESKRVFVRRR